MSYSISSGRFQHPLLKPLLEKLTEYFTKEGICFYVIGATARDIVMQIHNKEYGFAMDDMERDFTITYEDSDRGRNKKFKAGLVVFDWEKEHNQDNSSLFAHIPSCFLLFLQSSNI